MKELPINTPLVKALEQMPSYMKFIKYLVTKERRVIYEPVENVHHCSVIASRLLVEKKEGPGAFTMLFNIRSFDFSQYLCDLGSSINLKLLVVFKQL